MKDICSAMLNAEYKDVSFRFCDKSEEVKGNAIYVRMDNGWKMLYLNDNNYFRAIRGEIMASNRDEKIYISYICSNVYIFDVNDFDIGDDDYKKGENFYDKLKQYISGSSTMITLDYNSVNMMLTKDILHYFGGVYFIEDNHMNKSNFTEIKKSFMYLNDVDIIQKDNRNFYYLK